MAMPPKNDYYEVLGVPRSASDKDIKAAYRRLAREHHPDRNQGDPSAEDRFKEISEAFAVLSDSEKRAKYDRGGHEAFGPGFNPFEGFDFDLSRFGLGDLSDLFGMFGGAQAQPHRARHAGRDIRGRSVEFEFPVSFLDAVAGATLDLTLPDVRGGTGERVKVRIPPGIEDGGKVRLRGRGERGPRGGPRGDAYLLVRVKPHPRFRREGTDLFCDVEVSFTRSALGGTLTVPTLDGSSTVALPPGTRSGRKLRLRGKGVPAHGSRKAGDLYAVVQIVPPQDPDARSRELLLELERLNPGPS